MAAMSTGQQIARSARSVAPLEQAVAADPTDGYGRRNLGALLMKAGRNAEALAHLRERARHWRIKTCEAKSAADYAQT